MARLVLTCFTCLCVLSVNGVQDSYEYVQSLEERLQELDNDVSDRISQLEESVFDVEEDAASRIKALERRIYRGLRNARISMEAKVKYEILPNILPELVAKVVQNSFPSNQPGHNEELTRTKKAFQIVKNELRKLRRSMGKVQAENGFLKETVSKLSAKVELVRNVSEFCACVKGKVPSSDLQSKENDSRIATPKADLWDSSPNSPPCLTENSRAQLSLTTKPPDTNSISPLSTEMTTSEIKITPLPKLEDVANGILIVPRVNLNTTLQTLRINGRFDWANEFEDYPFTVSSVLSMVYILSEEKLYYSTYNPDMMFSTTLEPGTITPIKKGVVSNAMVADEGRHVLFHTNWRHSTINGLKTDIERYLLIARIPYNEGPLNAIAVDSLNKQIYTCDNKNLYKVSYSGNLVTKLRSGSFFSALTFDPFTSELFVADDHNIVSYSNGKVTKVNLLGYSAKSLVLHTKHARSLIVSSLDGDMVDIIYLNENSYRYHLPRPKTLTGHLMCLFNIDT